MFHSWLEHFLIDFPRFLFKHLFCSPFFHPFLFLSLLVSLSWFVSSSWIFHSSFFSSSFFFTIFHSVLFVLFFSFFWEEEHIFLVPFFLPSGCDGFSELFFLSTFASPVFVSFPLFLNKKKTFVLKSLLFCPSKKMVFENVLKFDLCHTSPFVFNSCITYFHFFHV